MPAPIAAGLVTGVGGIGAGSTAAGAGGTGAMAGAGPGLLSGSAATGSAGAASAGGASGGGFMKGLGTAQQSGGLLGGIGIGKDIAAMGAGVLNLFRARKEREAGRKYRRQLGKQIDMIRDEYMPALKEHAAGQIATLQAGAQPYQDALNVLWGSNAPNVMNPYKVAQQNLPDTYYPGHGPNDRGGAVTNVFRTNGGYSTTR